MALDPLIGAALIGAVGSIASGGASAGSSVLTSKLQLKNQKELSAYQNQLSLNNLTISPSLQMQGLKAAGISPQFMNGVNPAPSVSGGSAQAVNANVPPIDIGSSAQALSQADLNSARTTLTNANEDLLLIDKKYRNEINEANVKVTRANVRERETQANLNSQQWRLVDATITDTIMQTGLATQLIQADVRMKNIDMKMQYNNYIRDCYMTQNYETFYDLTLEQMRLNLGEAAAKIRNLNSDSNLKYNEAALVKEQKAVEALRRVNLGFQNEVASAVYKFQSASLVSRYIMEKKQFDRTYVPSMEEQKALFEAEKSIKELEVKAKQFDVDHQDERYIMEWVRLVGDQVSNVAGLIAPFKTPKLPPTQKTRTFKENSSGSWSETVTEKSYHH